MNVAMWRKALQVIPRVSKEEWDRLDIVCKWLIASRSAVLIITFISAALAGILAARAGMFDPVLWLLLTVGLIMAHATNNFLNDVVDYRRGVDKDNYYRAQYGAHPLEQGLMTLRDELTYAAVTGLIALAAGAYLVYLRGTLAVVLLALGAFFVLFYTYPLKYFGLGELSVLVVWGPLMIGGGYYAITGQWDWQVVLAGMPYALGATSIIFGKHIDKHDADKQMGIRTLPVSIGERAARYAVLAMLAAQYALVLYLVAVRFFTPVMLAVFLVVRTFWMVAGAYRQPRPKTMPEGYRADVWPLWFVAFAFFHNRRFGMVFLLGLLIDLAIRGLGLLGA